jgi:hypothetical protein
MAPVHCQSRSPPARTTCRNRSRTTRRSPWRSPFCIDCNATADRDARANPTADDFGTTRAAEPGSARPAAGPAAQCAAATAPVRRERPLVGLAENSPCFGTRP